MKDGTEHKGDSNADVNSKSCLCLQQLLPFVGVKKLKCGEINHQDDERTLIKVVWDYDFTDGHTANQVQELYEDSNPNLLEDVSD